MLAEREFDLIWALSVAGKLASDQLGLSEAGQGA